MLHGTSLKCIIFMIYVLVKSIFNYKTKCKFYNANKIFIFYINDPITT